MLNVESTFASSSLLIKIVEQTFIYIYIYLLYGRKRFCGSAPPPLLRGSSAAPPPLLLRSSSAHVPLLRRSSAAPLPLLRRSSSAHPPLMFRSSAAPPPLLRRSLVLLPVSYPVHHRRIMCVMMFSFVNNCDISVLFFDFFVFFVV